MPPENTKTTEPAVQSSFRHFRANGLSVHVDPFALKQLEWNIRDSVKAIRGHGVETGGLLLGHPVDWTTRRIVITGFTPVDIEYRFGPSYRPSENDVEAFREAQARAGGHAIGYFRSQLRSGMLVRDTDLNLLAQLFPDEDCCFAPIEATVDTPSVVSLHHVPAGAAPALCVRFPLKEIKTAAADPPPAVTLVDPDPPIPLPARPRPKIAVWIFGTGAALAAVTGAYLAGRRTAPVVIPPVPQAKTEVSSKPANTSAIGLQLLELGPETEIHWNPESPSVVAAVRGLLLLFDGSDPKRIELDSGQLKLGRYTYAPASAKITVWLTLYRADGSFVGDNREFKLTSAPNAKNAQNAPKPEAPNQPVVRQPPPAPVTRSVTLPNTRPVAPPLPVRAPELPEPPKAMAAAVSAPQFPAMQLPDLQVPDSKRPALNYKGAVNGSVPPRVIHQVTPAVPPALVSRIRSEAQLDVGVTIDIAGRVTGARVISTRGALAGLLTIEALKAAQLCRFSPAQEDGHTVPSNMVLTFRFTPKLH